MAPLYVLGIEKQIERLDATIDAKAIQELTLEINRTRDDSTHFPKVLLGITEP
ncbi:MAG: hypothetical protein ACO3RV_01230 [Luteolibacter sp.]